MTFINDSTISAIGFWGGIASILALIFMLLSYTKKILVKSKIQRQEQRKKFEELEKQVSSVVKKGTSFQKRQDIYLYMSILLNEGYHIENKLRKSAHLMHIFTFIFILNYWFSSSLEISDTKYLFTGIQIFLTFGLIYPNYNMYKEAERFTLQNEHYSKGFFRQANEFINKTYVQ